MQVELSIDSKLKISVCMCMLLVFIVHVAHWCLVYWRVNDAVTVINQRRIVFPMKDKLISGATCTCKVKEREHVHEGCVRNRYVTFVRN